MKAIISAIALALFAKGVEAQVGHLPQNSPYRDLDTSQEITFFGGRYSAGRDPIGVAPQDGPILGARYLIHVGGPAFLMARWSHVNSDRFAIDPTKIGAGRQLGKKNASVNLFDVDLALSLTGQKTFHRIEPVVNLGAGIAACGCTVANDPYTFGTPFAFTYGAGLRWIPAGRIQLTADWQHYLYQLKYPTAYYLAPTGGTAAVSSNQARSFWKGNRALTIGASLLFFR